MTSAKKISNNIYKSKLDHRNSLTFPREIREQLGLAPDMFLILKIIGNQIVIERDEIIDNEFERKKKKFLQYINTIQATDEDSSLNAEEFLKGSRRY